MAMKAGPPDARKMPWYDQPLRLIGIHAAEREALLKTRAIYVARFKANGLLIGSAGFGYFVYSFAKGMLRWETPEALAFAGCTAPLLLMAESYVVTSTLGLQKRSWWALFTRTLVVTFVLGGAVGELSERLRADVDSALAQNIQARQTALENVAPYQAQLAEARKALADASQQEGKLDALRQQELKLQSAVASSMAEYQMECDGATSPDGRTRVRKCGPLALGWKAQAQREQDQAKAVQAQIQSLGNPADLRQAAQGRVDAVLMEIKNQATRENSGAGAQMSGLAQAARNDPGVLMVAAFVLGCFLLPDVVTWLAMSRPAGKLNDHFAKLREVDDLKTQSQIEAYEQSVFDAATAALPPLEVLASHVSGPVTVQAAHQQAAAPGVAPIHAHRGGKANPANPAAPAGAAEPADDQAPPRRAAA